MGNLLTQAMALGEIAGLAELREAVRASVEVETWEPRSAGEWEDAYEKLRTFQK